jgi:uncharacterized protein (TIGR03435 family)
MRSVLFAVIALTSTTLAPAPAQLAPAPDLCAVGPRPIFDVTSVKPTERPDDAWMRRTSDGLTITGPLRRLIQYAYNLHDFQLTGGPAWLFSATWEIRAKSDSPDPDFAQLSDAQRQALYDKQMQELQSMLIDRFHFKCHMTTKEMPVYELVIAKSGSKLKESAGDASSRGNISVAVHGPLSHASGTGVGTARLAILLSGPTGRMVLDKTGLSASYDFVLDWVNDSTAAAQPLPDTSSGPSIYTASEEQLGLKLQPAKGMVPVLLIDQVDMPTEN